MYLPQFLGTWNSKNDTSCALMHLGFTYMLSIQGKNIFPGSQISKSDSFYLQHAKTKTKKEKLKSWDKFFDSCQYFTVWSHLFSNINFWIASFTNVSLLFKLKNLFDLKSISRNYYHKIDISFFLFMQWRYYFTRFIHLFICINSHSSSRCFHKWNLKLWKSCFLSLSGICNKKLRGKNEILSNAFIL